MLYLFHVEWLVRNGVSGRCNYYYSEGAYSFELVINNSVRASGEGHPSIFAAASDLSVKLDKLLSDPLFKYRGARLLVLFDNRERKWSVVTPTNTGFEDTELRYDTRFLAQEAIK